MKVIKNVLSLFPQLVVVLCFSAIAAAQPPPSAAPGQAKPKREIPSVQNVSESARFSSLEGRYTIALPRDINGFSALSPQQLGINASGAMVQWRLREGFVLIRFYDYLDPHFALTTDKSFADVRDSTLNQIKAKLITERSIRLGNYRGTAISFSLEDGRKGFLRNFYVDKRIYTILALPNTEADEPLLAKAFDTLTLIPEKAVVAQIQARIDASTPELLPQTPATPKEKSDAHDEDLRGKVKTVTEESEDRSGTWGTQGRKMSSVEDFNELGNRVKRVSYDSTGKPFQITVYGYLDGARVSNSKMINYDEDPPLMALGRPAGPSKPRDTRYQYKYAFRYTNGRLNEKQLILNNGENGMRYVTNYQGREKEELVYDDAGKLNMKFLYRLDDKGDEIESTYVNVLGNRTGDEHYRIRYESYDDNGNWTKKVTSKVISSGDKGTQNKDWYVTYRAITYH